MTGRTFAARSGLWLLGGAALVVALAALALVPQASAQAATGGPDLGGYTFRDSTAAGGPTYAFVDISNNGTQLVPALGDDTETQLTLPFSFTWYGVATTTIKVSSNGFVCFNPTTAGDCVGCCSYPGTPGAANPNRFVAGYYGDLHCNSNPNCAFSHSWGTTGNRVFVVMINQSGCFPFPSGCNLTFEYKIFEASQCVEVHYGSLTDPTGGSKFAGTEGRSPVGTYTGLSHYFANGPGGLANRAVRYCQTHQPPPECNPLTQTIVPGASATLTATSGTPPYTWSVTPTSGVSPTTGSGSSFTATFNNAGTYSVGVTGAGSTFTCTVSVVAPGCGYTIDANAQYDWVEIQNTGTTGPTFDDTPLSISAPFPFEFCGTTYSGTWRLGPNGMICFGVVNCSSFTPGPIPATFRPRPAVFGYWSDLFPPGCNPPCTFYQTIGTAPNRVFIYEERQVNFFPQQAPGPVTFEIKLFESTNCIEVHYQSVTSTGHAALAGYQDAAGGAGYTYAFTSPGFTRAQQAWSACPVPPFRANADSYNLNEDQPQQALPVLANDQNTAPGPITITAITTPTKGTAVVAGSQILYTPLVDRTGIDTFTYTITNSASQTSTGTITVNLQAVNDPPNFDVLIDRLLATPAEGPRVVPGWGGNLVPGPATATDEVSQGITFVVSSNSNAGIFSSSPTAHRTGSAGDTSPMIPPTVGGNALLRFAPSGNSGLAIVCFRAVDSGGTATVTNSFGATATGVDTGPERCVEILQNAPPIVYFEPGSSEASPREGVTFNPCPGPAPRCTFDPDGTITTWLWEFGDGYSSGDVQPTHAFDTPGEHMVRLSVWDDHGVRSSYGRTIAVAWGESAPVSEEAEEEPVAPVPEAGDDRIVVEGTLVRLEGTHRGGDAVRYEWTVVAGPRIQLEGADTATPTFRAPMLPTMDPVDVTLELRVSEGPATSGADHVTVRIVSGNRAPAAIVETTVTAIAGSVVTLDASRSTDEDGDELRYTWRQEVLPGETVVSLLDPSSPTPTFVAPDRSGLLHFRVTVSDGRAESTDHVTVEVRPQPVAAAPLGGPESAQQAMPAHPNAAVAPAAAATNWLPVAVSVGLLVLVGLGIAGIVWRIRR